MPVSGESGLISQLTGSTGNFQAIASEAIAMTFLHRREDGAGIAEILREPEIEPALAYGTARSGLPRNDPDAPARNPGRADWKTRAKFF